METRDYNLLLQNPTDPLYVHRVWPVKPDHTMSDKRLANFIQLLQEKRLEMHVPIKGQPSLEERRKRISRLTGLEKK